MVTSKSITFLYTKPSFSEFKITAAIYVQQKWTNTNKKYSSLFASKSSGIMPEDRQKLLKLQQDAKTQHMLNIIKLPFDSKVFVKSIHSSHLFTC